MNFLETTIGKFTQEARLVKKDDRYEVYDLAIERLVVSMTVLYPGKSTSGHEHDTEEVYLFLEGEGEIQLDDKTRKVAGGDVIMIPSKVFHRVFNIDTSKLVFLCLFEKYLGRGKRDPVVVCVSGGYDPIHIGHVRNIQEAKKLGDTLIVILNRDDQLIRKKGFVFMPLAERKEVLENIRGVDVVLVSDDKGITCNETLELIKPNIFAKGGDRTGDNMPEIELELCKRIGCRIVYNIGGDKVQSSSNLLKSLKEDLP